MLSVSCQLVSCLVFTINEFDPYGYHGWFGVITTQLLHDAGVLFILLASLAMTHLFAKILAAFHPPTHRVLRAVKGLATFMCLAFAIDVLMVWNAHASLRPFVVTVYGLVAAIVMLLVIVGGSLYTITVLSPNHALLPTASELVARQKMRRLVRTQQFLGGVFAFWALYPAIAPDSIAAHPWKQIAVLELQSLTIIVGAVAFLALLGRTASSEESSRNSVSVNRVEVIVSSSPVDSHNPSRPLVRAAF